MPHAGIRGAVVFALLAGPALAQPPTADQQAEQLLASARKAFNDGNPRFAAEAFREFLEKFGGNANASAARYGLGLALLDLQPPDYPKAIDALGPLATAANFPDRANALYYLAVAHRGAGLKESGKEAEARFADAAKFFAQARAAYEKKPDADRAARARCDTAEMELRLNKPKEARATTEPFLKDTVLTKSNVRPLGLYYHGLACFLLKDNPAAGRSLNQLAPFDQPFGPHARYLMGRVHQSEGEFAEAAAAFAAVAAEYEKQKKQAEERLRQPDAFKTDPGEKARLEALARGPVPDYVAGAAFHGACLNYEAGKFAEALPKFQTFATVYADSPLKPDALLRAGFCLVQLRQFDEAAKLLQPLTKEAAVADQAFYWLGKAQVGQQAHAAAVGSLRSAIEKAKPLADKDANAKARLAEYRLELADALLTANQPREAVTTYEALWIEKALPNRSEEVLQRLVTALHLADDYSASDARAADFQKRFPNSPLLPAVVFRTAESAYARAELLAKQNKPAKPAFATAAAKYEGLIARFPEFERVNRARFGLALCLVAAEDFEKAIATLEAVAAPDRTGELAAVSFVLADCLIRTAPAKAEDARQDNMLREKLTAAAGLLDAFVGAAPKAAEAADALLKLGYCYKRLGTQFPPGNERNDLLNKARGTYERLSREYARSPLVGTAAFERAKMIALQGDKSEAVSALRQFLADPLQKTPVAPLAVIHLATLLREQNQASQAAQLLQEARQKFEDTLAADPTRADWVHLLRYHHGVCLFEVGKVAESRAAFDQVMKTAAGKPIAAEAALKQAQCLADDARKKIEGFEKDRQKPSLRPEQLTDLDGKIRATKAELAGVARLFERRADEFNQSQPQSEARARMLYDAAWAYKAVGQDPTAPYTKLITQFPGLSLSVEARLELAEVLTDAGKADATLKLLRAALDTEPTDKPTPPETTERIRLRLGAAHFATKDFAAALAQFDAVAGNDQSPHRGPALYRSAECLMATEKFEEAKEKLKVFRDDGLFHNVPGVSDRAVLRLGHCYLHLKQWEPARQTFQAVLDRFGNNNPWATDARYGLGTALQQQGRFDDAASAFAQVTQMTRDERAAQAHLQVGLCRAAQKRWDDAGKAFQTVYYGYDAPDLKFAAMLEHARVLVEDKKPDEAVKLLERVIRDAPKDGPWAKAAGERLEKVKK